MSFDLKIREMTEKDLPIVRELWKEAGIELTLSDTIPELKRMLDHNPGLCLVAVDQKNDIISAVLGGFDGRRGWVHHLAVRPSYQKKGIGKWMMEKLTECFRQKQVVKIKLEVLKTNINVVNFYKRLNWDFRDDLVTMSLTLRQEKE